jgi:heme-degrading monooxygenase HmoA
MVLLFRSDLRPNIDMDDYRATRARLMGLVANDPGFISYKTYTGEDGDTVAIVKFASEEALEAWRSHPEHVAAQRRGQEEFYEWYSIQVCRSVRAYEWRRSQGYVFDSGRRDLKQSTPGH